MNKLTLAREVRLTVRSISALEAGDRCPSEETLAELARVLRFPVAFFLRPDLEEPSTDGASFRALASMTASQRDMALASGVLAIEFERWIDTRFQLPAPNVPSMRGFEPEAAADALRAHWSIGERSIQNLVHLLEASGVRVFSLPSDAESVNAFSLWHRDVPYMFLTTDKSGERGRFDAAHELGHLALHRQSGPRARESEFEADRFAGAFLMPQSSVLAVAPRNPGISGLIQLKRRWKVALVALVHRLRDLRILTEWQYRTLCIEASKQGYRTTEPEGIPRETSQVLGKVFASLQRDGISRETIARELCLPRAELEALVFGLVVSLVPGRGDRSGRPRPRATARPNLRLLH